MAISDSPAQDELDALLAAQRELTTAKGEYDDARERFMHALMHAQK